MENPRNFWPEEIGNQKVEVPKTLMVEQANFFNEMTKNRLVAQVNSQHGMSGNEHQIVHEFDITVPSLGNYTFTLFTVFHGLTSYPLAIFFDLENEKLGEFSAEEFETAIKKILTSKKTISTINGLLAQI